MRDIVLAGGCFWGLERALGALPGVLSTECGYANGNPCYVPSYELVCTGLFGYREAVRVEYDEDAVSLEHLLDAFLFLIDPTQEGRQGNDVGEQYRTGAYWTDPGSGEVVRRVFAEAAQAYPEFHVEAGPLAGWTRAEEHHQRYLEKNPGGYCHIPASELEELLWMVGEGRWPVPGKSRFI